MNNDDLRITLYAARVNAGYSRSEVSRLTGLSLQTIGKYEAGQAEPKASMLQKLCLLYGVGIEQLRFDNVKPIVTGAGRPRRKKEEGDEGKTDGHGK